MIRYVTQGEGAKLKRYVSLHRGEGVKIVSNWHYVVFGRPLTMIEPLNRLVIIFTYY